MWPFNRADRPAAPKPTRLNAHRAHNNLTRTRDGKVIAWYVLADQTWSGLPEHEARNLVERQAYILSQLIGYQGLHLRGTIHPFQRQNWGRALEERIPNPLPSTEGFTNDDWIEAMGGHLSSAGASEPFIAVGVPLRSPVADGTWKKIEQVDLQHPMPDAKVTTELAKLNRTMNLAGWDARPLTEAELWWLFHRSTALGVPAPELPYLGGEGPWEPYHFDEFTDAVDLSWHPAEKTLRLSTVRNGQVVDLRVAVLVAGHMRSRPLNPLSMSRSAWLTYARKIGLPHVEFSSRWDIIPGDNLERVFLDRITKARFIGKNYAENDTEVPHDVALAVEDLKAAHQEVTHADPVVSTRVRTTWYAALAGPDEQTLLEMVDHFQTRYATGQGIQWHHFPDAQYALARSFIPGEPVPAHPGMRQQAKALYVATSVPNATTSLGDGVGPLHGFTAEDGRRPFLWDTHYVHEVLDRGGVVTVKSTQGGGKSFFAAGIGYAAVQMGEPTSLMDPAGVMAHQFAQLPEIAPVIEHIDLSGDDVKPGLLAASAMRDPDRREFKTEEAWKKAVARTYQKRQTAVQDQLQQCLPGAMQEKESTEALLGAAVRQVDCKYGMNPWQVIYALRDMGDDESRRIMSVLEGIADHQYGRLFFPEDRTANYVVAEDHADRVRRYFKIVSMRGITPPREDTDPKQWDATERLVFPLLTGASFLTAQTVYKDLTTPKTVILDEGKALVRTASGRALALDLAENASRKHKATVVLTMLDASGVKQLGLTNYVNTGFVGRMLEKEKADEALQVLRRPPGSVYVEQTLSLPTGQFFALDVHGRFGRVQVDYSWNPRLVEALRSKPIDRSHGELQEAA